jgi:HEAT repeat protein
LGLALAATPLTRTSGQDQRDAEIAQLIKSIERNPLHAEEAARELMRIGKPAVPALIAALKSPEPEVRSVAAGTLPGIRPVDERVLPALVEAMSRVSSPPGWSFPFAYDEGLTLALALRAMGPDAVKPVIQNLNHERPFARATAALALSGLFDETGPMRGKAAAPDRKPIALDREVVARLIVLLDDHEAPVRSAAVVALMTIDPNDLQAEAVIAGLVKRLRDPFERVRSYAALAVSRFGSRAKAAVGPLADWFRRETQPWIQAQVAEALGSLGAEAAPAVPMLIAAARDKDADVRENAIFALGLIGPKVEGVLPVVRAALADPDVSVRSRASSALAAIDGPEVTKLIESLRGREARAQKSAADALAEMGPKAAPAVPALIAHLADDHEGVLDSAVRALDAIGAPAVLALVESLGHENPRLRLGAAEVLGRIGLPAAPAGDKLAALRAGDPDPQVRRYAALALAASRPGDPKSIDALTEALRDKNQHTDRRIHGAAQAIAGGLGRSGKNEAIATLIEVLARLDSRGSSRARPNRTGAAVELPPLPGGPGQRTSTGAIPRETEGDTLGCLIVQGALEQVGPEALPILLSALGRKEVQGGLAGVFRKIGAPAVPALIAALQSDDPTRRAGAASALTWIAYSEENRPATRPAVPALIAALSDMDPRVRTEAAGALGVIGTDDTRAGALLIRQMADPDEAAANRAAVALREGRVRAEPGTAVPALTALFDRPDEEVHRRAEEALATIGPPAVPALLKLLKEGNRSGRVGAVGALQEMEVKNDSRLEAVADTVAIPLAEALKDHDEWVRERACHTLGCLGEKAAPALPTLIALLNHKSPATRAKAAEVLGNFGAKADPALIRALDDPEAAVRAAAAGSLGGGVLHAGSTGTGGLDRLLHALKDNNPGVRAAAADSLGWTIEALFGRPDGPDITSELFPDLDLPGARADTMKVMAAGAFSLIAGRPASAMLRTLSGEEAAARWEGPLLAGLTPALADSDADVRQNAARSLGKMGTRAERALDPLLERINDPDENVRSAIAEAIGHLGPVAVPRLAKLLAGDRAHIRATAAAALGHVKPATAIRPALDAFIKTLEDPDVEVRVQAIQALAWTSSYDRDGFQRLAPRMIDPLLEGLKHRDPKARRAASHAIEWTAPKAQRDIDVIPALIVALHDPDADVRKNAAGALGAFGDRALQAVPALREACKDADDDVQAKAANAIEAISE